MPHPEPNRRTQVKSGPHAPGSLAPLGAEKSSRSAGVERGKFTMKALGVLAAAVIAAGAMAGASSAALN